MIITPKLYMSDLLDDFPSKTYSGALYPLHDDSIYQHTDMRTNVTSNDGLFNCVSYNDIRSDVVLARELLSSLDKPKSVIFGTM